MSDARPWSRQKAEIDAYNTFISSHHSRNSYHGFSEQGYEITNYFPTISDQYSDIIAEPDLLLYNGETLIQVEIKNSENFEPRHAKQMERCTKITIQKAEEYLKNSGVTERFGFSGEVYSTESCIVYHGMDEEYLKQCRNDWPNCAENLAKVKSQAPILGQEPGGKLRVLTGEFSSDDIQQWLTYGISLPKNPRTAVSITDGMELESVAVAICNIWGQRAVSSEVTLSLGQIRQHFDHRELSPGRINESLQFLNELDVCRKESDREYVFSPKDISRILNIERLIAARDQADEGQSGLSDFST